MAVEQRGAETRLRADAQENYDRLVAAAGRMFSLHGTDASLKPSPRRPESESVLSIVAFRPASS